MALRRWRREQPIGEAGRKGRTARADSFSRMGLLATGCDIPLSRNPGSVPPGGQLAAAVTMMTEYLVYPIDGARYAGPTQIIACETDVEAIEQAKALLEGDDLEVWDEGRFVAAVQWPRRPG
jgi:hypothetical protein